MGVQAAGRGTWTWTGGLQPRQSVMVPRPMVVGLSPHKPAAAPSTSNKGGAPALMDTLTDLEPRVTINHKTYGKGT